MGSVTSHDMDAVDELVSSIAEQDDKQVNEVEGVKPYNHGVRVTLTVEIPTRVKGMTAGGDDLDQ